MKKKVIALVGLPFLVACAGSGQASGGQLEQLRQEHNERLTRLESQVESIQTENAESVQRVESMVDILQAELSKKQEEKPKAAPKAPSRAKGSEESLVELANYALGVTDDPVTREEDSFKVDRKWLRRELKALLQGKTPVISSNRSGGVRIKGIKPKSLLAELGLRNNDVVMSLNGTLINTPTGISRELSSANGEVKLVLQRRKQETTYTYSWK